MVRQRVISSVGLSLSPSLSTLRSIIGTRNNLQQNMQNINLHRFCVWVVLVVVVVMLSACHPSTTTPRHMTLSSVCVCVWAPLAVMFAFTCVNYQEWPGNKNNATKKHTHSVIMASKERTIEKTAKSAFLHKNVCCHYRRHYCSHHARHYDLIELTQRIEMCSAKSEPKQTFMHIGH